MEEPPVQSLTHYYSSLVPENSHNRIFFSQYSPADSGIFDSSPLLQYSETQNSKAEPSSSEHAYRRSRYMGEDMVFNVRIEYLDEKPEEHIAMWVMLKSSNLG